MANENANGSEKIIDREEAARRLAVSVHEVRRRQKTGELKPIRKKGEKGEVLFRVEDVDALSLKLANRLKEYSAEDAAKVFAGLEKGLTPIQCVALKVRPSAVEAITAAYAKMKGGVYLTGEEIATINTMELDGPFPVKTGEEIVAAFKFFAEAKCLECKKRDRMVCVTCVKEALKRVKAPTDGL
jgi:DNA-binding transcriptional MerR regulator